MQSGREYSLADSGLLWSQTDLNLNLVLGLRMGLSDRAPDLHAQGPVFDAQFFYFVGSLWTTTFSSPSPGLLLCVSELNNLRRIQGIIQPKHLKALHRQEVPFLPGDLRT